MPRNRSLSSLLGAEPTGLEPLFWLLRVPKNSLRAHSGASLHLGQGGLSLNRCSTHQLGNPFGSGSEVSAPLCPFSGFSARNIHSANFFPPPGASPLPFLYFKHRSYSAATLCSGKRGCSFSIKSETFVAVIAVVMASALNFPTSAEYLSLLVLRGSSQIDAFEGSI